MSLAGEEDPDPTTMDHLVPDPLLMAGSFIDPNSISNDGPEPESLSDHLGVENSPATPLPSNRQDGSDPATDKPPDWLPPGWKFIERVRSSGASAGTRDKYYLDPLTNRQFRSRKEVLRYVETGSLRKKKRNTTPDAVNTTASITNSQTPSKRKKAETKAKELAKYFDFDDVPTKVKWELADIYEESWRPLINGVDRVPESSKQEWAAAFTYLTLQNGGGRPF